METLFCGGQAMRVSASRCSYGLDPVLHHRGRDETAAVVVATVQVDAIHSEYGAAIARSRAGAQADDERWQEERTATATSRQRFISEPTSQI